MAINVTHSKVSTIPDGDDSSLIRPSDWNDDHVIDGLGTMAEQNANNVNITGGTISGVTLPASNITGTLDVPHGGTGATTLTGYVKGAGTTALTASSTIPNTDITGLGTASTKDAGVALGVATLDAGGTIPLSQIPASIIGGLNYQGTWNASTNTPTLTSSVGTKGYYYAVSVSGTTNLNGITDWNVGDLAVFDGSAWQQIDNTDAVTSVNGYTGTVVLTNTDISGFGTMSTQNANAVAITGGTINGAVIGGSAPADITGNTITAATTFISENYKGLPGVGGNLKTSAGTSLLNWDGAGAGNITVNGGLNANPSNKNVSIAPTGTGTATINPATAGTMNNMIIGGTTPLAGNFTDLSVTGTTKFDGSEGTSGQVLTSAGTGATPTWTTPTTGTVTSVAASAGTGISVSGSPITTSGTLTITNTAPDQTVAISSGTGISVTGTYPNFTVTNTAPSSGGTVTSVTATAPVASTGGTTPVISMPAATTSVSGYLTSTDWNTFNSKGSGTVTSVTATSPVTSTGGTTPVIAMPAATGSVNGYLTSTDWTTFNSKAPAVTYTTSYVPFGQGTTTPNQSSSFTYASSTLTAPIVSASNGLVVNSNTVSASYSIPSGSSASSVGPMTVASGQSVTVPSGSRWVVL